VVMVSKASEPQIRIDMESPWSERREEGESRGALRSRVEDLDGVAGHAQRAGRQRGLQVDLAAGADLA